jgi:chemotaxis signal transduction protein
VAAGVRFLVVRLAGREFAVPAWRVCGMMQMRGLHVEPMEGFGAMRYLATVHGKALPVYVPNGVLGLEDRPVSARSCLLLIRGASTASVDHLDAADAQCALVVDPISRLEEIPHSSCRPAEKAAHPDPSQVRLGEKWREVIDLDSVCHNRAQAVRSRIT